MIEHIQHEGGDAVGSVKLASVSALMSVAKDLRALCRHGKCRGPADPLARRRDERVLAGKPSLIRHSVLRFTLNAISLDQCPA